MKIKIYQVNMGRDENRTAFMGMDEREHFLPSPAIDSSIAGSRRRARRSQKPLRLILPVRSYSATSRPLIR